MKVNVTRIKMARIKKGWSQEKLAALIDRDQTTISAIESEKSTGFPDTLKLIADALDLSMDDLLIQDETESPLTQGA